MRHCLQLDVSNNLFCLLFFFTLYGVNTKNCLLDINNGNLQTTIIFFKHYASSHKTDWIFTDPIGCFVLPFISQGKHSDACSSRRITLPTRNLYKCKHVVYDIVVCVFCYVSPGSVVVACLFSSLFLFYVAICCHIY